MQTARNLKTYRKEVAKALSNDFQRQAMDKFAVAYRNSRDNAFADLDSEALVAEIARIKDHALERLDDLFARFKENAEKIGVQVHLARTAEEANALVASIAEENQVQRIVKSKSMTAEETLLNHYLEARGLEVTETDLGEWIIQLRGEGPSHMVMPAIHLSRFQVADLFSDVTGKAQNAEIERLVKVARRELRRKYVEADMGISGGQLRLGRNRHHRAHHQRGQCPPGDHPAAGTCGAGGHRQTAARAGRRPSDQQGFAPECHRPGYHVLRHLDHRSQCLRSSSGGQKDHAHRFSWTTDAAGWPAIPTSPRCCVAFAAGPAPMSARVYRMVGGHQYGHIYIGAIGLILTYFLHGRDKARNLVQNCINCGACKGGLRRRYRSAAIDKGRAR